MSYEGEMLRDLRMPARASVEVRILRALLRHRGVLKEFAVGADIVDEIADELGLNKDQRSATLERVYRKENRAVQSLLWHRLLFRAADSLANSGLVSRPTATLRLPGRREWMLTERGIDEALKVEGRPDIDKEHLGIKSIEVQKMMRTITHRPRPTNYDPIQPNKEVVRRSSESFLRSRGFRLAVIEAYDYRCSFCGLKLSSPDSLTWEVEAAHIVPNTMRGKDDIWNGLALCRTHHWAFDVGWLTLDPTFAIEVSGRIEQLPANCGRAGDVDLIRMFVPKRSRITLPTDSNLFPHENALSWHRANCFVS